MLSQASDPIDGVYALGGYALLNGFGVVGTGNFYYGIRRFPKAIMSSTGGPNNRPHNPMTFADVDSTQSNTTDGAFPAMSCPHISTTADQVHAAGEICGTDIAGKAPSVVFDCANQHPQMSSDCAACCSGRRWMT